LTEGSHEKWDFDGKHIRLFQMIFLGKADPVNSFWSFIPLSMSVAYGLEKMVLTRKR
jgi:hypothetical protein